MREIVPILRPRGPVSLGESSRHKFLHTISFVCKLHRATREYLGALRQHRPDGRRPCN
jgi:hypothetical protein